jgi:hypothetical protein
MTPRQRQEFDRLQQRNKFLEQFNREQHSRIRALERDRSMPPKGGMNLLRWMAERESGAANLSKSDIRAARSLLGWLERRALPTSAEPR